MSTFSYQTPVQFWWKWILYKLTLVLQSGWPLPRVPLNQGDPPCSFPPWPPGPRQGWAAGSDRFWLLELRVFQTFLDNLRPICSGPGYPTQRAANTFCPRSDPFWLLELRVSQHFSTFYEPSVQAMDAQLNAPSTLPVLARTVSGCLNSAFSRHFYAFYEPSVQTMDTQVTRQRSGTGRPSVEGDRPVRRPCPNQ